MEELTFFGFAEHYDASLCLFLHTFELKSEFEQCCSVGVKTCDLLQTQTSQNSASERQDGGRSSLLSLFSAHSQSQSSQPRSQYLSTYTSDPRTLASMYEGNRLDCELYGRAKAVFFERIRRMEIDRGLPAHSFVSQVSKPIVFISAS